MDVVLNSLAGRFVAASLRLLPRGGRFLEMGKTDIRDAEAVGRQHPGVAYRAFDLMEAGPDLIPALLREVVALLEAGGLAPLPRGGYGLRHAASGFPPLAEARPFRGVVPAPPPGLGRG